jgi:hypothetical protein
MPAIHQMGHDSENLLRENGLSRFRGAILSPVNYAIDKVAAQIAFSRTLNGFRVIFDPQLYFPNSERGQLTTWPYFPSDVDTADLSSDAWWERLVELVASTVIALEPDAVCSPAVVPRTYEDGYFETAVAACEKLATKLAQTKTAVIQTAVVGLPDLTIPGRAFAIASILSRAPTDEVYLVLVGNTEPRRELRDPEELKGAMRLIQSLENADVRVTVGFSSSDIVLWKHAGATSCASGKFFNLRRFTRNRFEEPSGGGGQLPYWFEESLLAFLRESDLARIRQAGLLSDTSKANPFGQEVLTVLDQSPGTAWLAKSWRQYLWWFADIETRITTGAVNVPIFLKQVEQTWQDIEDKILMEEPTNNGAWLRAWRRACIEFQ